MREHKLEPGILQVFRLYAIIRIVLLVLATTAGDFFPPPGLSRSPQMNPKGLSENDPIIYLISIVIEMVLLLTYLSVPWFRRRLGKVFLPLGLIFAAGAVLTEPLFSVHFGQIWSSDPFLFLLVILIAWQYDAIWVFVFTAATIGLDLLLGPGETSQRLIASSALEINPAIYLVGKNLLRSSSFIIIGFVVTQLSKAQRSQREELQEANKRLLRHNVTLEQLTVSQERNRLSRELHDTLAHTLSAMTVQLDAVTTIWENTPPKVKNMLENMLETTRSGLDETRRALHSLRASPLEDLGLTLAVNALAEDIASRYSLKYHGQIDGKLPVLPPEIEQCYYRVAQEALENVGRHAKASKITLLLNKVDHELVLEIRDDGIGVVDEAFSQDERLGIKGMHERAEQINAILSISGTPDAGTTVRLVKEIEG